MLKLRQITGSTVKNKTVLVRAGFDVPLKRDRGRWQVADDSRIKAGLSTLQFLTQHQAKTLILAHLGRPAGHELQELSLEPVAHHLGQLLGRSVIFIHNLEDATAQLAQLKPGQLAMLENLRFDPGEEENSAAFAKKLAALGEIYVNDAFSVSHRAHASIAAITKHLPSYAGLSLAEEVKQLHQLLVKPKRPFIMVIGGKKISDKVGAVVNLAQVADAVLLGGGTANNFLKAEGFDIFKSVIEESRPDLHKKTTNYVKVAEELIEHTSHNRLLKDGYIPLPKIIYPIDVVAATSVESKSGDVIELVNDNHEHAMKKNLMYLDIGPKTIKLYRELILQAGTVFWNGPMGVFEQPAFAAGTLAVAQATAKSSATTVIGGGDTIAAATQFGLQDRFDYVSAAGGAALEFLAGKHLPGLQPLLDKDSTS